MNLFIIGKAFTIKQETELDIETHFDFTRLTRKRQNGAVIRTERISESIWTALINEIDSRSKLILSDFQSLKRCCCRFKLCNIFSSDKSKAENYAIKNGTIQITKGLDVIRILKSLSMVESMQKQLFSKMKRKMAKLQSQKAISCKESVKASIVKVPKEKSKGLRIVEGLKESTTQKHDLVDLLLGIFGRDFNEPLEADPDLS